MSTYEQKELLDKVVKILAFLADTTVCSDITEDGMVGLYKILTMLEGDIQKVLDSLD